MYVCVQINVWVWRMCVWWMYKMHAQVMCVFRDQPGTPSNLLYGSLSYSSETGFFTEPGTRLGAISPTNSAGVAGVCMQPGFLHLFWDLNSGSYVCTPHSSTHWAISLSQPWQLWEELVRSFVERLPCFSSDLTVSQLEEEKHKGIVSVAVYIQDTVYHMSQFCGQWPWWHDRECLPVVIPPSHTIFFGRSCIQPTDKGSAPWGTEWLPQVLAIVPCRCFIYLSSLT